MATMPAMVSRRPVAQPKPVTLQTIAEATGYSRHTVGFVLNGSKEFPEATREKVLRAAHELGYRPNASARAIRSGRFKAVGFLDDMDSGRSYLNPRLLRGIAEVLTAHDHHLVLSRFHDAQLDGQGRLPKALTQLLVDGFLLNYHSEVPAALDRWIAGGRSPAVWINRIREFDSVRPDDIGAGRDIARFCLQHGHQRIAYIDGSFHRHASQSRHFSKDLRLEGYRLAMREAGLKPLEILDFVGSSSDLLKMLRSPQVDATAAICYAREDIATLGIIAPFLGIDLGKDLLLTGIGDLEAAIGVPVSYMAIDWDALGRQAATVLLERLDGAEPIAARLVPCRMLADARAPSLG
jgi:LacI family transcriptional regulator